MRTHLRRDALPSRCATAFSFDQRPRIISRHYWRPPGKGAHKSNRVLTVHADTCLSVITDSEPLVRTGAQVGCHCHNESGFAPTVMLIFIARSFPKSWRMDVRGSQVSAHTNLAAHLCAAIQFSSYLKNYIVLHKVAVGN